MVEDGQQNPKPGLLTSGLANWPNDDLLLTTSARDHIRSLYPTAVTVLDWPEHAALFLEADEVANHSKRVRRRLGVAALTIGIGSVLLTAISPLLVGLGLTVPWVGLASALGTTISIALGLNYLFGSTRMTWLTQRFRTERLREFYFQFLLNNLSLATSAMSDADSLERWKRSRADHLAIFKRDVVDPVEVSLARLDRDILLQDTWIFPMWKTAPRLQESSPELMTLIDVLWRQRFGIQQRYSLAKAKPFIWTPQTLAPYVRVTADVAGALIWGLTPIIAMLLAFQYEVGTPPLLWVIVASAVLGVVVSGLRAIDGGFQLQAEGDRMIWYLAAITALEGELGSGTLGERIAALRDLEVLSYDELRRFILAQKSARFML
jgi:hypothetical protein